MYPGSMRINLLNTICGKSILLFAARGRQYGILRSTERRRGFPSKNQTDIYPKAANRIWNRIRDSRILADLPALCRLDVCQTAQRPRRNRFQSAEGWEQGFPTDFLAAYKTENTRYLCNRPRPNTPCLRL